MSDLFGSGSDSDDMGLDLFGTPKTPIKPVTFPEKKETEKNDFTLKVNNAKKLAEHLSKYFNTEKYTDVTFEVDSKKITAHKFVLAARR